METSKLLSDQRRAFRADPDPSVAVRKDRLARLLRLTTRYEQDFVRAIDADFCGRSAHETRLAELFIVRVGIRHAMRHLKHWARVRRVHTQLHFRPGANRLRPQPLGVVGVVAPWNYPLQLSLGPALAALSAGNRVMIKPSELAPRFSEVLARAVAQFFDPAELTVVQGSVEVGRNFVEQPFDHLFFTGSTTVGRQVAQAASVNLTPLTLELGGKSPAIIDPSADLGRAISRLAYGKLLNAGQTCIAPDYLMVPRGQADTLAARLSQAIGRLYPSLRANPDYSSMISPRHWQRLHDMVAEARARGASVLEVNPAGENLAGTRKFAPTLVLNPPDDIRLMREEIFGPVLPIVEVDSTDAAIDRINRGDRPLALYWFGQDRARQEQVMRQTHSGGVTVNDCLWHIAQEEQPFGGVGASGTGAYHGVWGFERFSHLKPVFYQSRWAGGALFRPPYGRTFDRVLSWLDRLS
jgi:coniferyl-aldehyde dehydrogenase